jgi:negative regulator of genetic competence, sporulation and motility
MIETANDDGVEVIVNNSQSDHKLSRRNRQLHGNNNNYAGDLEDQNEENVVEIESEKEDSSVESNSDISMPEMV